MTGQEDAPALVAMRNLGILQGILRENQSKIRVLKTRVNCQIPHQDTEFRLLLLEHQAQTILVAIETIEAVVEAFQVRLEDIADCLPYEHLVEQNFPEIVPV